MFGRAELFVSISGLTPPARQEWGKQSPVRDHGGIKKPDFRALIHGLTATQINGTDDFAIICGELIRRKCFEKEGVNQMNHGPLRRGLLGVPDADAAGLASIPFIFAQVTASS